MAPGIIVAGGEVAFRFAAAQHFRVVFGSFDKTDHLFDSGALTEAGVKAKFCGQLAADRHAADADFHMVAQPGGVSQVHHAGQVLRHAVAERTAEQQHRRLNVQRLLDDFLRRQVRRQQVRFIPCVGKAARDHFQADVMHRVQWCQYDFAHGITPLSRPD